MDNRLNAHKRVALLLSAMLLTATACDTPPLYLAKASSKRATLGPLPNHPESKHDRTSRRSASSSSGAPKTRKRELGRIGDVSTAGCGRPRHMALEGERLYHAVGGNDHRADALGDAAECETR